MATQTIGVLDVGQGGIHPLQRGAPFRYLDAATMNESAQGTDNLNAVASAYPLSPLQQGLLFNSLTAQQPGVDVEQVIMTLPEEIVVAAWESAWARAIERHAILRTGFRWSDTLRPIQEVRESADFTPTTQDWSSLESEAQARALKEYLAIDRRSKFDLAKPPLIRLALFRSGPAESVVVLTFHHLILDGRSLATLLNDVFSNYEAQLRGRTIDENKVYLYRNYIDWLEGENKHAAEKFWRETLKRFQSPTPLPGKGTPVAGASEAPGEHLLEISEERTAAWTSYARRQGVTLNTLLQGAWALVLGRCSGEEEVVFGAVRACRHLPVDGISGMVGPTINTVPMRVSLPCEQTVGAWLQGLRDTWVGLRPYEFTSLVEIQSWSDVPPGMPLFTTIFNFQDPSWDAALKAQGGAWTHRQFEILSQPSYPLAVDAYGGPQLRIKLIYDRRFFDATTIERLLERYEVALVGLTSDPELRLVDVSILTDTERRKMLIEWNRTSSVELEATTADQLVARHVRSTPDALAVASESVRLSYGELDRQAEEIAVRLRERGVGRGTLVGVCLERSPSLIAALLAVWKAGAAYVPIDPEYPHSRQAFILKDVGARVVLTQRSLVDRLPVGQASIVGVDIEGDAPGQKTAVFAAHEANLDDLAYVIYTSGSTGTPKGVAVTHRSLNNLIAWHRTAYRVTSEDRATQIASPAFDAAVWEIWPYLAAGASVHLPNDETRLVPGRLVRWLDESKITLCFLPTPLAEATLAETWPAEMGLRAVLTGGDRLHRRPGPGFPSVLVNHYGPTESTVVATSGVVAPQLNANDGMPSIGRPIANTQVYVLDRHARLAPLGATGELYIGGAGLARGYLNRPELTAEKFVPNPFEPGRRLYRTGDRVRWCEDGDLEFLGRLDDQVKLRGHRIELGEIEAALAAHPGVRQVAVVLHEPARGEKRLVAFGVAAQTPVPTTAALRSFLQERLPEALVPAAFCWREALPLSAHGKIDRRALAASFTSEVKATELPAEARGEVEEALVRMWSELLGVKKIGRDENFFELGGHSLLATQVVMRIRAELGIELSVHIVFDRPTIAGLAEAIGQGASTRLPSLAPLRRRARNRPPIELVEVSPA